MISKIIASGIKGSISGWKSPSHLILHITSRCNSRCGMCFAWRRLNKEKDLTISEIKKLASSLKDLVFLDISGGEPFLRKDLDDVLAAFEKYSPNAYVNLPTNGFLPNVIEKKTKDILSKTKLPISLNLSLDGTENIHDSIRGVKGGFKKVIETYKKLVPIKKKNPRFSIKVSTCVSNKNFSEIEKISDFVKTNFPEAEFHTLILVRGDPRNKEFSLPPIKDLSKKRKVFYSVWEKYGFGKNLGFLGDKVANISHRLFFDLYLDALKNKKMSFPCLAGKAHAVVYANGDVSLCELGKPVGNIRKEKFDFYKIWNSKEANAQRMRISKNCCYCTHGCNWTDNVFLNPFYYPKLLVGLIKHL